MSMAANVHKLIHCTLRPIGFVVFFALRTAPAHADYRVVFQVDVQNPAASASPRLPAGGSYQILLRDTMARCELPGGSVVLIDFGKNVVSKLTPNGASFYQLKLADYLDFGEHLAPALTDRHSVHDTDLFSPVVGQSDRAIMGQPASPFNLDLEALVQAKGQSSNRGFGGRGGRRGGGFPGGGFPGGSSEPRSPAIGQSIQSAGCSLIGEAWLNTDAPTDLDLAHVSTAELCAIYQGSPGLRFLSDKLRKAKQMLAAANFTVNVLDAGGQIPLNAPRVTVEVRQIERVRTTDSDFLIPADYTKTAPPPGVLGTL